MKILNAAQVKEADVYTIAHEPVSSEALMERAAGECFKWITSRFDSSKEFLIFCGPGNNGGDGLVLARLLFHSHFKVSVYIVTVESVPSGDHLLNAKRLQNETNVSVNQIADAANIPDINSSSIIIDALFGIGLKQPLKGLYYQVIDAINKSNATVIAIDLPSGLFADESSIQHAGAIIKATYTLTFQNPKLAFYFAENALYTGELVIINIGLDEQFIDSLKSNYELISQETVRQIIKKRNRFSHKGDFGHAAIVAGSYGKSGAAVLAVRSCLVAGAGLVTAHIPSGSYTIIQTAVPEAMVVCDENIEKITTKFSTLKYNAVGIGPGIGTAEATAIVLKHLIQEFRQPMVFDADAINILAENKTWIEFLVPGSVLTPHPGEFERLAGKSSNHFNRNKLQVEFSKRYRVYVILKGMYTCISTPEGHCYFNTTGNPGMAKGGTGDTLTGIVTAFIAQRYEPMHSCIATVYLHGLAADIAVSKTGEYSLMASDIIDNIGNAFLDLKI
jgi:ADP-dependent NAD(P)H-hydrate dehydratase / NAD(P)H-hydrate epimerase